jgi:hypothetical protein
MGVVGTWDLLHWRRTGSDGQLVFPLGEDARGLLVYTRNGHVIVQMAASGRAPIEGTDPLGGSVEERAAAYSGFLGYFGTYEVQGGDIVHHVDSCSYPNWSQTVAIRPFELHGEQLILRTPPTASHGTTWVNEMAWQRTPASHPAEV